MADNDNDQDDLFAAIIADFGDVAVPEDVQPVTSLSDADLLLEYSQVKRDLLRAGDMLSNRPSPTTDRLLSRRTALMVEIARRQLT